MGIFDFLKRDKQPDEAPPTPIGAKSSAPSNSRPPAQTPAPGGIGRLPQIDTKGVPKFFQGDSND